MKICDRCQRRRVPAGLHGESLQTLEKRKRTGGPGHHGGHDRAASREELARILCTAEFCECCDYEKDGGVCHYIEEHPDGLLFDSCVEAAERWLGKIVEKL